MSWFFIHPHQCYNDVLSKRITHPQVVPERFLFQHIIKLQEWGRGTEEGMISCEQLQSGSQGLCGKNKYSAGAFIITL